MWGLCPDTYLSFTVTLTGSQLQPFVFPQSVRAFGIDHEAFGLGDGVRLAPTPPRMPDSDLSQSGAQPLFVAIESLRPILLHRTVLADHPAGTPLRDPELLDEHNNHSPPTVGAHQFPRLISVSMSMSRACSATSFLRR
jgi:hypothetical protein